MEDLQKIVFDMSKNALNTSFWNLNKYLFNIIIAVSHERKVNIFVCTWFSHCD